jgi:hypothetical protein
MPLTIAERWREFAANILPEDCQVDRLLFAKVAFYQATIAAIAEFGGPAAAGEYWVEIDAWAMELEGAVVALMAPPNGDDPLGGVMFTRFYRGLEVSCDTAEEAEALDFEIWLLTLKDEGKIEEFERGGERYFRLTPKGRAAGLAMLPPAGGEPS